MTLDIKTCRSCGAEIIWVITRKGKRMPLDAEPVENGNVLVSVSAQDDRPMAHVVAPGEGSHRSHFVTCPNAKKHRR